MRGMPKTLGSTADVYHLARGLPVPQAIALVESLTDAAWERLRATAEQRAEVAEIVKSRLETEDKKARRQQAVARNIHEGIAARSDADAIARDARRLKEERDDVRAHLADLRADGVEESLLNELTVRLVDLESLFASTLIRHNALIDKLSRLRKKAADEEV